MKSIIDIICESSHVKSEIDWIDWNTENLTEVFKEIVDEVIEDKSKQYKVNVLVIAKEKKSKSEEDKFKGNFKLMPTEVVIHWTTNPSPEIDFWSKNIANDTITKFIPMEMALPKEFQTNHSTGK